MNKIAVTGSNGMTGRHMLSLLKVKGIPYKGITRKEWDLNEWKTFSELDYIFDSVNAIFHFGAQLPKCNINDEDSRTQQIFDVNIRSSLNLAEWAKSRDIPIIFISSGVVYMNPHASNIKETDPKVVNGFGGFYGFSKLLVERIFDHLSTEGLKYTILRPSSIYGYGLPSKKLIQNFIEKASKNEDIIITGHKNEINFIHACDVTNAAFQAYKSQAWGIFNISSNEINTILDVANIAISITSSKSKVFLKDHKNSEKVTRFDLDSDLAKKSFGFEAKINLKEGMTLMKEKLFAPC